MTIVLKSKIIRRNLSICLKNNALIWHTIELANIFRKILIYEQNVKKSIQTLIQKFKQQTITTTASLLKKSYIMKNARKLRKSKKYAQRIIRLTKSAQIKSVFNQLNIIYNGVEVKLRRDLRRFINMNIIDEYLKEIDECKQIWWKLTNERKIQNGYNSNR